MVIKIDWATMKATIDNNPTINFFWAEENEFSSNHPSIPDRNRYFIRLPISDENQCFLSKDGGSEETDFDDNYKTLLRAIETL